MPRAHTNIKLQQVRQRGIDELLDSDFKYYQDNKRDNISTILGYEFHPDFIKSNIINNDKWCYKKVGVVPPRSSLRSNPSTYRFNS